MSAGMAPPGDANWSFLVSSGAPVYELRVETQFSAAHRLRDYDGKEQTQIDMDSKSLRLALRKEMYKGFVEFVIVEPTKTSLERTRKQLNHRNGMVEAVRAEGEGKRLVYRIRRALP